MKALTPLALALALCAPVLAAPAVVQAAEKPKAQVAVTIGPELQAKSRRYGAREFDYLSKELSDAVAVRAAQGGFTRVDLVLEDARPNRPTFAMLTREPSLSLNSVAVGGAKITGVAYGPAGPVPLKSAWFETDLRQEVGVSTWTDAERAFDFLGSELKSGKAPQKFGPGVPGPETRVDLRDPWTRDN